MRAVMLMFDSLNKRMLPNYGCEWIKAPNFERLTERTVMFDKCYAGSLPCMPARRELHTGRYNFMHRSWGPLEPYEEDDMPLAVTVSRGIEFIERNRKQDRLFVQIEAFDPHEPFFTQQKYKDLYPHEYDGKHYDWPDYAKVTQKPEEIQHMIFQYAALVSMCDAYLGKVLDTFDQYDLWQDTMLIVNTDHGFLLGEHQWWGKIFSLFTTRS